MAMFAVDMVSSRTRTSDPMKEVLGEAEAPSGIGVEDTGRAPKCFEARATNSECSTPPVPTRTIRSAV